MKRKLKIVVTFLFTAISIGCSTENALIISPTTSLPKVNSSLSLPTLNYTVNYLALGDSYTIGQSVCETCKFPEQLKESLRNLNLQNKFSLEVIARTGWTTSELIQAIETNKPAPNFDLVTLLIGVNNQYRGLNFSIYEKKFPQLVSKAINLAKGDKNKLMVISIPDYTYTPYGQGFGNNENISKEIDRYNSFAKSYCESNEILFINITDITRQGLNNTNLIASDGLQHSDYTYRIFVERILPRAVTILNK